MPPQLSDSDTQHLQRALTLAREAQAFASPNPTVGCVLTSAAGEPLGEGAHLYDNRDHAEIAALKAAADAGRSVKGAIAYVTLEPCTVHGRTGPCADALIAASIARCVVATADPNPAVCGRGISQLKSAGIETILLDLTDALAIEARRLNDAFAFSITHGRPFVTLKAALSIDGKLAPPPASRAETAPHWLTGEAARTDVQQLRHAHDAILTGIGTVIADNPSLTDRSGLPRRRPLLRIVLDSHLRIPLNSNLVASANGDLVVICGPRASAQSEAALVREGIEVQRLADPGDLMQLFAALQPYDLRSLLLESGTQLNGAFFAADLVDRVVMYYAESELGPAALSFSADGTSPFELQQRLTDTTRTSFPNGMGEDIRITGYLHDPWM